MKWRCRFPEPIRVSIYHHTFDSFLMRFRCQMICRVHFAFFTTTEAAKPDAMLAQPHVSFVWAIRMPPGVVTHPARRTRPAAGFAASRNRRLGPPTPRRLRRRIRLARRQVLCVGKLVELGSDNTSFNDIARGPDERETSLGLTVLPLLGLLLLSAVFHEPHMFN